jgi:hypothetical protein
MRLPSISLFVGHIRHELGAVGSAEPEYQMVENDDSLRLGTVN